LKNQISSLVIDINTKTDEDLAEDMDELLFTHIFTTFTNLRLLVFNTSISYQYLSINIFPPTFNSSTLKGFHIR
jgi:hypothetical protein